MTIHFLHGWLVSPEPSPHRVQKVHKLALELLSAYGLRDWSFALIGDHCSAKNHDGFFSGFGACFGDTLRYDEAELDLAKHSWP